MFAEDKCLSIGRLCEKTGLSSTTAKREIAFLKKSGCLERRLSFSAGLKTDDVDFLCKLARYLQKEYNLSRHNTFLTGMPNGGEMCYLMAKKIA